MPDVGLLVSPDHRIVLRGARARALYNADEVLVTARDLIKDHSIIRDHAQREVTYISHYVAEPRNRVCQRRRDRKLPPRQRRTVGNGRRISRPDV